MVHTFLSCFSMYRTFANPSRCLNFRNIKRNPGLPRSLKINILVIPARIKLGIYPRQCVCVCEYACTCTCVRAHVCRAVCVCACVCVWCWGACVLCSRCCPGVSCSRCWGACVSCCRCWGWCWGWCCRGWGWGWGILLCSPTHKNVFSPIPGNPGASK